MNNKSFIKAVFSWLLYAILLPVSFCLISGCNPFPGGGGGGGSKETTIESQDMVTVTFDDVSFTFVKCRRCSSFDMPINFHRSQSESIDHVFYIMDSELTIAQYEALKKFNPKLPELSEFNKNCVPADRNNSQVEHKNEPLHGIIPLDDKDSPDGLRYANMICQTLNDVINSDRVKFSKDIHGTKTVQIPTAVQWYYAAVAVNKSKDLFDYRHFGTVYGRDYANGNCLNGIILNSEGGQSLEEIQKTYMRKYWQMIWDENFHSSISFDATPNQIIEILLNSNVLSIKDDKEDIKQIVKEMPLTFLRCLLFDKSSNNEHYLFEPSFTAVKNGELPNNWGLYDVRSNASELVMDDDMSNGYSVMGGHNGVVISQEDNWKQYLLWKKTPSVELDQYNMPGLRLIFTTDQEDDSEPEIDIDEEITEDDASEFDFNLDEEITEDDASEPEIELAEYSTSEEEEYVPESESTSTSSDDGWQEFFSDMFTLLIAIVIIYIIWGRNAF